MIEVFRSPRRMIMAGIDLWVLAGCYYLAFVLRLDQVRLAGLVHVFWKTLPLAVFFGFAGMYLGGVYRGVWRYVSLNDLLKIIRGTAFGLAMFMPAVVFLHGMKGYPRSVFLINAFLVVLGISGVRVARRVQMEILQPAKVKGGGRKVLIVGAGDAADDLIRELRQNPKIRFEPVGLVDDSAEKRGTEMHGVKVLGSIDNLVPLATDTEAEEILIAIASASGPQMRRIIGLCRETKLPYRTLPGVGDILGGRVQIELLRNVDVEDLLRREPVKLDRTAIEADLAGRRVLVTGAGGSIGSEICRQVGKFSPAEIILLDHSENSLFYVEEQFGRNCPWVPIRVVVADIMNRARIENVMQSLQPDVVFHAAAHKHVYLMERNYCAALRNNITGTRIVAEEAASAGVRKFVMISTDKAVNPTSVMGLSKRIAELVVQEVAARGVGRPRTDFVAVRFGNVMGSEGSVIPLWQRQIKASRSITVTHPEVVRYFMTIPEAVQLVLQAASMGRGGETFVLDMGEPIRVLDLAREVIRLSGLEPDEVEIKFTGLRPGEKLYEELITTGEGIVPTTHEKIMVLRSHEGGLGDEMVRRIRHLEDLAAQCAPREEVLALAKEIVPEYQWDPHASAPSSGAP